MEQITIDDLIDKTIDSIKRKGVDNSLPVIYRLYNYILLNIEELPQIKRKQTAGMTFAFLSYRKLSGCTKFPAMAYYCLTQATKHLPVFFPLHLVSTYIITSTAERVKFLLNGGMWLIEPKIHTLSDIPSLSDIPPQAAFDFSVLGDIIFLKKKGYSTDESWWQSALEDEINVRTMYSEYTDNEIFSISEKVHDAIAHKIYKELVFYGDSIKSLEEGWKVKD